MNLRLPNVLIIGAMKAGTTSLFMDLAAHPDVLLTGDKEPHALCSDKVLSEQGRQEYADLYGQPTEGTIVDASTGYAKRPDFQSVAERAVKVLPAGFKVIYLLREPIARIISHHYHDFSRGDAGPNIDEAVREHPRFVNYSRYAYQLEPWIDAVGRERIQVVRFEDYTGDRLSVVSQLYGFLGLPELSEQLDAEKVYNKSQDKPVRKGMWSVIYHNSIYRNMLRPLLPVEFRMKLARLLLPKAPEKPEPPSDDTLAWLRDELVEDSQRLRTLLQLDAPLWPLLQPEPVTQDASGN